MSSTAAPCFYGRLRTYLFSHYFGFLCALFLTGVFAPASHAQFDGWTVPGGGWALYGQFYVDSSGACTDACFNRGGTPNYCSVRPSDNWLEYRCTSSHVFYAAAFQSASSQGWGDGCSVSEGGYCDGPPPPPPIQEANCDEIQQSWNAGEIAFVPDGSAQISSFCTPFYSLDDEECQNVAGYVNDHQICTDDQDECQASGGFYGLVGRGDEPWTAVCIPDDFGDDIPTCDSDGIVQLTLTDTDGSGGFVCESPITPPEEEDPFTPRDPNQPAEPCSPGFNCEGDPYYQPPVAPPTDPTPPDPNSPTTETGDDGSVSGGGTCSSRPVCSGDAIGCAIQYQAWETRCAVEGVGDLLEESFEQTTIDELTDTVPTESTDLSSILSGVFATQGAAGSCPASLSVSLSFAVLPFDFTLICNFLGYVRPLIILLFAWHSFGIVTRAF